MRPCPFPLITASPFWRATTPEELGAVLSAPPEPGDLDFHPGWTLGFFSVVTSAGRAGRWGWIKGAFAVNDVPLAADEHPAPTADGLLGILSHLPTGRRIGNFVSAEEAAFAADLIGPVADWTGMTEAMIPAASRATAEALRAAGFERILAQYDFDGCPGIIARRIATVH